MGELVDRLKADVRIKESLNACIHCGTCTAICPAASFYDYDPRELTATVQEIASKNNDHQLTELLRSDYIWYCGECMSCKTRCPRDNTPGVIIEALRALSQDTGLFAESEKGRQQLMIKRSIGEWIVDYGYCVVGDKLNLNLFPEQGPNWQWVLENIDLVFQKQGAHYQQEGSGAMRKVPDEDLEELKKIYKVTGAYERFRIIEDFSEKKAKEMGLQFDESHDCEYFRHVYTYNSKQ
jgi:heterodisulfide reductase subunit C1